MRTKCKCCGVRFENNRFGRNWCSEDCRKELQQKAFDKAKAKYEEQKRNQTLPKIRTNKPLERKSAIKTNGTTKSIRQTSNNERPKLIRQLQILFNAHIRQRDKDLPCISCGCYVEVGQAGHYKSVGSHPELRFNLDNVHKQCEKCNIELSGNIENYRIGLIKRIGLSRVEALEQYQTNKRLTNEELRCMIKELKH